MRTERIFGDGGSVLERGAGSAMPGANGLVPFAVIGADAAQTAAELYRLAYEQAREALRPSVWERARVATWN